MSTEIAFLSVKTIHKNVEYGGKKKSSFLLSTSNNFGKVELLSTSAYTESIVKRMEEEHLNFFFFCKLSNLIESQKQGARVLERPFNRLSPLPTNKRRNGKILEFGETWVG